MEQAPQLMVLFGSLISLLLSVVAYFIKQLHTDFKRMEKDLVEVKTMALLIKTEFKSSSDLLNQKVDYLEHRVQKLEMLCIHEHQSETIQRVKAPTPKFFKVLRTIGLALATVGGTIIASPIALPAGLVAAAGYLVLGGGVLSAVSQTAVQDDDEPRVPQEDRVQ